MFKLKREAQAAILAAYTKPLDTAMTFDAFADDWDHEEQGRQARTGRTHDQKIRGMRKIKIEGRDLERWPLRELDERHIDAVIDHLARRRVDGHGAHSLKGVRAYLAVLSMLSDAKRAGIIPTNPAIGVTIRAGG